jgi:hypothetical protein
MSTKWSPKDPDDVSDYLFDWGSTNITDPTQRFLADAETILTFTITPDTGITVISSAITSAGKAVTFRVSGGTAGDSYNIACLINTSAGETFEITKPLKVQERISP